ncbi:hypothetical protein BC829DRAFT_116892 [Chytridium lagenaria]|nr:hypothetical protein BC829DRAFT_116892 [Chytridium lagenaria]
MVDDISEDLVTDREVPLSKIANISDLLKESGDLFSSTTSEKAENSPIKDILEVKDLEPPSRPNTHQLVKDRHNGSSNSKVEESTSAKADTKRNHEAHDAQQSSNFNASLNSRQDHTLSPSITLQHDHTSTPNHHFNHSDSVKNTRSASTQQAPIPPQPTPTYAPYPSQYLPQTPQPSIQYPHPPMPYPCILTLCIPRPCFSLTHSKPGGTISQSQMQRQKSPSHCHGHHTCGCRPPVPSPQAQIPRMLFEDSSSEEKIRRRHKPKSSKKSKKHSSKEEPKTKFKRKGKERVELEDLEKECEGAASSPTPEASTSKVPFEKRAAPDYTKPLFDDSHTSMFSMPSVNLALMLRLNPNTQILDSMIGNHLEMIRQFVRLNSRLIREDSR